MTLAHGTGAQQYDELIVAGVLLVVLALAVLHLRWQARQREALLADTEAARSAEAP
jgi:hypothetical protein